MLKSEFYCTDTLSSSILSLMTKKKEKEENEKNKKNRVFKKKLKNSSRNPIFCFNLSISVCLIVLFYLILILYSLGSLFIIYRNFDKNLFISEKHKDMQSIFIYQLETYAAYQ